MKVVVTGGRTFGAHVKDKDRELTRYEALFVCEVLESYRYEITELAQGGAKGADKVSRLWAVSRDIQCWSYEPEWHKYGKAATLVRNIEMLTDFKPHFVIAFPGGNGTAHCKEQATKRGIEVRDYVQ